MADEQLRQQKMKEGKTSIVKNVNKIVAPVKTPKVNEDKKELVKSEEKEKNYVKKTEEKVKKVKKKQAPKENKHSAVVNVKNLPISLKHSKYIARFIKYKKIDVAVSDLELVLRKKIAVPFKGEVAHRKGKGMMSGKFPVKACGYFIKVLKSLSANSAMNGMEMEKTRITEVICNKAPDQMHRFGRMKFKKTHVTIKSSDLGRKK
ncbi:MAG: uL22 family ribosomal protein [Nanoarchaeota archaeon]|nr:uL22 family ribosomal protein [Nanoarchaeota archaeon]